MGEMTQILSEIEGGDTTAAEQLLPFIYDELRRLAAHKMAGESPDHTLQATALVHEAYLRLMDVSQAQHWNNRGHFFAAAAEAMRRILIESARQKKSLKNQPNGRRQGLSDIMLQVGRDSMDLLALDEALKQLEIQDPSKAELVKLRFFCGFTVEEAASLMGISRATAKRYWVYARAWLHAQVADSENF